MELEVYRPCRCWIIPPRSDKSLSLPEQYGGTTPLPGAIQKSSQVFQQMNVNDRATELLFYTVYALHVLFHTPIFEDDFKERERRARVEL